MFSFFSIEHKLLLVFLLLFCVKNDALAQQKAIANYPYLLYLPKDYHNNARKYPLVIYLHGGSQRGNDLNKLNGYGLPYLVSKGKDFPFIVASPQCPADRYWSADNWFGPLYKLLAQQYRIDSNRIYITGISIGGYSAYIAAMDFPDKFAAVVALCGGCNDSDTSRICVLKHTPIWAFHGTADDKIPISETERIVNALQQCNGNIRFTKLENAGHGLEYLYEKNRAIYRWMLKQHK